MRRLVIPFEWQPVVIRAAITLQQNVFDDTGAIIAAKTTSAPEAAGLERNWDYRYCRLRDSHFVVDTLNRLNATDTMEHYLRYVLNFVAGNGGAGNAACLPNQRRPGIRRGAGGGRNGLHEADSQFESKQSLVLTRYSGSKLSCESTTA